MENAREIILFLSFFIGALRSTPEGRARRALSAKQRAERKLHRIQERWRKDRLKYVANLRKDWSKEKLTREEYEYELEQYDISYPQPK
jgi:hypothetical protein